MRWLRTWGQMRPRSRRQGRKPGHSVVGQQVPQAASHKVAEVLVQRLLFQAEVVLLIDVAVTSLTTAVTVVEALRSTVHPLQSLPAPQKAEGVLIAMLVELPEVRC